MKARFLISSVAATLLGMAALTSPHIARATPINGSINLSSLGVILSSLNGTDLSNSTTFELTLDQQTTGTQTGDFTSVGLGSALTTSPLDLTNITAFTFGSAAFGTFDATTLTILHQSTTNLDLFLTGTFTPGTDFGPGATALAGASDHISLNETGVGANASIAWAASFASPPARIPTNVPEPAPLFVLGAGLCLVALLRWRKGT